jgi:hypothetical protein
VTLAGHVQTSVVLELDTALTRAVILTVNYSNIQIIKLTVTVRRIFALFEEFNVGLY